MGRRDVAHWLIFGLWALGAVAVAGPAGAIASQVTVSDPSPGDFVPPRPPPPPRQVFLGASITTNSAGWSQGLRRSEATGVLVLLVVPRSPAVVSGLVPGDVIVGVQGRRLSNDEQLAVEIRSPASNDLSMTVLSPDGARRTVVAHLQPGAASSLSEFEQRPAANPTPVSRLLYARRHADPKVAMTVLDQLIDSHPGFAPAHTFRAQRLLQLAVTDNDRSPARETAIRAAIDTAVSLDPESLEVHRTAAQILAALGDGPGTERHAAQAVAIDDASAQAHHLLGRARLGRGRPREALAHLRRAVALDPYAEAAYADLSACYTALGRPEPAQQTDDALAELRAAGRSTASTAPGQPLSVAVAALAALAVGGAVPLAQRRRTGRTRRRPPKQPDRPVAPPGLWAVEALAAVAVLSIALAAYGQRLGLSPAGPSSREIVNHLIPAAGVLVFCGLAVRLLLRGDEAADYIFVMTTAVLLGGLWMTATHLALIADVFNGTTTVEIALLHLTPGPATIILAILLYRAHPQATWTTPRDRRPPVAKRAGSATTRRP